MGKNLYIGNLSPEVTQEDLRENFEKVGRVVSAVIIKDKFTGASRGFGFVEMATEKDAQEAIQRFNGGKLADRSIVVNEARPRDEQRKPGRPGGGGGGGFKKRGRF
jgi:RNA recognition motif-containing protein